MDGQIDVKTSLRIDSIVKIGGGGGMGGKAILRISKLSAHKGKTYLHDTNL